MGDVAMLQVMVSQLRTVWPSASLEIITNAPASLAIQCPGTKPVPYMGRYSWFGDDYLLGKLHQRLPVWASRGLAALKRWVGRTFPALLETIIRLKAQPRHIEGDPRAFLEAVDGADLVVVSGMGGLTDSAHLHANLVLETLALAIRRGKPTALFSQGVGPIDDPKLLAKVKAVLPRVGLVGLRERRAGWPLLESLGVAAERTIVTGDDAIPLAYAMRPQQPGAGIGVNLRVANYAGTDVSFIEKIRTPLHAFAAAHQAPLIALPIALHAGAKDPQTIQQLLAGYNQPANSAYADGAQAVTTPRQVIAQAARCRMVVTGAYHPAVFALSQGIPAVCLTQSQYYTDKYLGLAQQFGTGCDIVYLNSPTLSDDLTAAMHHAWDCADQLRQPLRLAAEHQIALIEQAYQRLPDLLTQHRSAA